MRRLILAVLGLLCIFPATAQTLPDIPITFTLAEAGYITIVIEDQAGNRIRNLIQETYFPAGTHTVSWDGYDVGYPVNRPRPEGEYDIERQLVAAGTYRIKGLFHKGISYKYEFSVQSPGSTPWLTDDARGGWLSDQQTSYDVVWLPAGAVGMTPDPTLFFAAKTGEAGDALMLLDEDGNKVFGKQSIPEGFFGANNVARDMGTNVNADLAAYLAVPDSLTLRIHHLKGSNGNVNSDPATYPLLVNDEANVKGIAVFDQYVAVSLYLLNEIVFFDYPNRTVLKSVPVTSPRGMYVTEDQTLYVLEGTEVVRYDAHFAAGDLTGRTVVVASGLEDPQGLTIHNDELYVTDWGTSHQVKVFDLNGVLQRTIGSPGGPQIGLYDETGMAYPRGIAVDGRNQLWVAEKHKAPKRISRWDALTGAFDRAWYGPPKYGGGGMLDPYDQTRFYYSQAGKDDKKRGYEFEIDWATGTSHVSRILIDDEHHPTGVDLPTRRAPEYARLVDGRKYLVNNNQEPQAGRGAVTVWLLENDRLWPVAAAGPTSEWTAVSELNEWPAYANDNRKVFFVWSDLDRDGDVEPGEVQYHSQDKFQGTVYVEEDLSVTSIWGYKVGAPTIQSNGVPLYDIDTWTAFAPDSVGNDFHSYHLSNDSLFISMLGPLTFFKDGRLIAQYHSQWPNRNPDEVPVPTEQYPGQLVETARVLGDFVEPRGGDAGLIWGINSDYGQAYLFTWDGYFVTKILEDDRTHPIWRFPEGEIRRGDEIAGVSAEFEQFWLTLNQGADGEVYLVAGKEHASILRVDGLDSIQRFDFGDVVVTEEDLSGAGDTITEGFAPLAFITSPALDEKFIVPSDVPILTDVSDTDGIVTKVEFYADGALIGEVFSEPFDFTWTNVPAGAHTLQIIAIDDDGNAGPSGEVPILVNTLPTASIVAPQADSIFHALATITIEAEAADEDGSVTNVAFWRDGVFLGDVATPPYTFTWTDVAAGTYDLYVVATDNEGDTTTSEIVPVTVNALPTVTLNQPAEGDVYTLPSDIDLRAVADDDDGSVAKVAFYADSTLLGEVTASPFSMTWSDAVSGTYAITAVATDDRGGETRSDTVNIIVNDPGAVMITAPTDGQVFVAPTDIVIEATADDTDGTVTKVAFFRKNVLLGEDTTAPYSFTWVEPGTNTHDLIAVATDDQGATTASDTVTVIVTEAPTATIQNIADGAVFTLGDDLDIRIIATDDGAVTQVEVFADTTSLAVLTEAPYSYLWSAPPAGAYALTVVATDDLGVQTTSDTVNVVVNDPGTVTITAPTDGQVFVWPADVVIDATATDNDGTVTKVEFFRKNVLLGEDTTAPYSFTWVEPGTNTHDLIAVATDDQGATTASDTVTVIVTEAPTANIQNLDEGATFVEGEDVDIRVNATDDGVVTQVEIFADTTSLAVLTEAPYTYLWPDLQVGTYALTAVATDDHGVQTTSDAVTIEVQAAVADLTITLTPLNPPIEIGAGGGLYEYDIDVVNTGTISETTDIWVTLSGPGITFTKGPIPITVAAGGAFGATIAQNVPAGAAAGTYTQSGSIGTFPIADQSDSFTFEKLAGKQRGGPVVDNWNSTFDALIAEMTEEPIPETYGLDQNYPNPFNPQTTITYDLPESVPVRLTIYDALGREVARLVDGVLPAGTHRTVWNAGRMASGLYFYDLRAGDFHQVKTMILLR